MPVTMKFAKRERGSKSKPLSQGEAAAAAPATGTAAAAAAAAAAATTSTTAAAVPSAAAPPPAANLRRSPVSDDPRGPTYLVGLGDRWQIALTVSIDSIILHMPNGKEQAFTLDSIKHWGSTDECFFFVFHKQTGAGPAATASRLSVSTPDGKAIAAACMASATQFVENMIDEDLLDEGLDPRRLDRMSQQPDAQPPMSARHYGAPLMSERGYGLEGENPSFRVRAHTTPRGATAGVQPADDIIQGVAVATSAPQGVRGGALPFIAEGVELPAG